MRKIRVTLSLVIAIAAGALCVWAVVGHKAGYAVASAMLTGSALYAALRGPQGYVGTKLH